MYSLSNRRGYHRKRLSTLRLSSDSTVTTLPVYTSPPRQRQPDLPEIPSEQPPAYSDSAEEGDEDTDPSESESATVYNPSPPPSLPLSPRRARRSQAAVRSHRRQQSIANASDPFLDSLLERSVHALEMSNALLQSSMSTQTSLSAVLADDTVVDRHLEERAQRLTSRIRKNRNQQESWMEDLDEISRGVEGLVRGEDSSDDEGEQPQAAQTPISQSLPSSSGFSERVQQRQSRRQASQDFRRHRASKSTTNLQLSAHDRSAFVAPAPRAITIYVDHSEAADLITLPSTLGVRPSSRPPPTPLPMHVSGVPSEPESAPAPVEHSRVAEMLASYVMPRASSSASSSPPASRGRRSSSSSGATIRRPRVSKSPPPPIRVDAPSCSSSTALSSRSITPTHGSPAVRHVRPLTPPIEELSTSSASSGSATLHVDRTVESLRQILEKQRSASHQSGKNRASSSHSAPPIPRPSLLSPPTVAPVSGTSNATASISRLFTKSRHTTSSRAASPPKQSSLKNRASGSVPSTPITPAIPSPSPSLLHIPDLFGLGARTRSGGSSGASTPKRISFVEPPESYSSSKPEGSSSKFRATKTRSKPNSSLGSKGGSRGRDSSAKGKGKGKGKDTGDDGENDGERVGWWTGWLLGAAGTEGGSGLSLGVGRARSEERYAYATARSSGVGGTWIRPGMGGSLEEWGA